jgi:hypothetical protein
MSNGDAQEPGSVAVPVVRHFIACDRVERSPDGRSYSLIRLVHAIRPLPGAPYPRIHPGVWLFVQMSNGRGPSEFQIRLVFLDDETSIYTTPTVTLDLGQDPLVVHGWPVQIRNIFFRRPGLYEFRLTCNGREIAREPILLRESR